jgi:hypothetical protein
LKEFDDWWDNFITSKEIGFDKMWSDFMLEVECMKLGWERDEYENIDISAKNMFKRASNGEIVIDDEEEEEGELLMWMHNPTIGNQRQNNALKVRLKETNASS